MNAEDNNYEKLDGVSKWLIITSVILLVFAFFTPLIFTRYSGIVDFENTGQIGDTIGGTLSPFIALVGVIITFLAFHIQYKANVRQKKEFRKSLAEENIKFEKQLNLQKDHFQKQINLQIENEKRDAIEKQFYEMLRLHKENVKELKIQLHNSNNTFIEGREVFKLYTFELELCYIVAKEKFNQKKTKKLINEAYGIFFNGIHRSIPDNDNFLVDLKLIKNRHYEYNYMSINDVLIEILNKDFNIKETYKISLFDGHYTHLGHYYRHLFQTVKFIVSNTHLSYEEKRNYLRVLRAQLSTNEQVMLFYNWYAGFGKNWESDTNHFFTDYRMIHNIFNSMLIKDIKLEEIREFNREMLNEANREFDDLFEFQEFFRSKNN